MIDLKAIQQAIATGDYQYTSHAVERTTERRISRIEIEKTIATGKILEEYPDDKYGPSCLVYGKTNAGRPLHVLVSSPPSAVKIISAYEPDPDEWEEYQVRKEQ